MSHDGWAALPWGAGGLSAVCDCGISWLYSLTIIVIFTTKNVVYNCDNCIIETVKTSTHNLFFDRSKKNNVYHCKLEFYYAQMEVESV